MSVLLVIVPDKISDILRKGEYSARYYNPGELFNEVHILITNDDCPDPEMLQKTVGNAKLRVHNLPATRKLFLRSFGWRPWLLKRWAEPAISLAKRVKPSLIRCHGGHLNAFAAYSIKRELGTPYVVSLHTAIDRDICKQLYNWRSRIAEKVIKSVEKMTLQNANLVMPVYQSILPYIQRLGIGNYEVCYNVLNPLYLKKKDDYSLHNPVRIVSVGRQLKGKNPEYLIRAVSTLQNAHLTLIGDGSYHNYLHRVAEESGAVGRVTFYKALPNDELCESLSNYDIFATHSDYLEISKSVLEPLLTGMPIVMNRRKGRPVPELTEDICLLVENTIDGYRAALERLIKNDDLRESLGRKAYAHAQANWSPKRTEAKFAEIYQRIIEKNS